MSNRFKKMLEQAENRAEDKAAVNADSERSDDKSSDIKAVVASIHDIFANVPPKKRGGDITVYLTSEVLEAVNTLSQQHKISKSRLVDKALRQVLEIR